MKEKILFFISCIYLLILGPELVRMRTATLVNNGFEGVLVSISSDIKAYDQATINNYVSNIANLISNASLELYNATENRAYFAKVEIMLPSSWTGNTDDQTIAFDQSRYQKSDIRVDLANVAYGDMPYVQQSRGCGEPGDFIHITPNFLLGRTAPYGTVGRILAREWIKYYFGVFDEQGYDYSLMYPPKYFTSSDNAEITSCSNAQVNYRTMTCGGESSVAGIPKSCQLEVDQNVQQANVISSSIMAFPIIPVASKVCNSSTHNSNAPNKQNAMCDGKSVLDVILNNAQFQGGINTPSKLPTPLKTTFSTSQIGPNTRMALYVVFDNLDSDRNYYSLGPAISKFIKIDLPFESYFGFTTSENSTTVKTFKQIVSDSDRDDIISEIQPSKSTISGGDIVAAVQTAVTNLNSLKENPTGFNFYQTILIVTNATDSSKWSSICQLTNQNGYNIHLITYASGTVTSYLNAQCEGSQVIIKGSDQQTWSNAEIATCSKLLQERQQVDRFIRNLPSVVLPSIYSAPKVYLDRMYFNSTNVTFTTEDSTGYSIDTDFYVETCQNLHTPHEYNNLIKCGVGTKKCTAEPASSSTTCLNMDIINSTSWTFDCREGFTDYVVPFVATAIGKTLSKSGSSTPKESIQLYSWVSSTYDAANQYTKVRIFGNLKKSTTPVLNARVVALVTSETSANQTIILLRDDGSGNPDITANDGVYSAYFTQFGSSSAYSVTVKADDNSVASVPTKQYPWITHIDDMGLTPTGKFSRESLAGSFVGNSTIKGLDNIEPGRILDLRVQSSSGSTVTLVWTAPGNDLDYGTADKYYLKCSTNKNDVSATNFGTNDQISSVSVSKPSNASTLESATIEGSIDGTLHYCAIRACDAKLQWSTPSNVVSYMMVDDGLSTATTTAIALGVVFGIIALILIIVLIWYCCFRKPKPAKEVNGTDGNKDKLRPISGGSVKSAYDPVPQVDLEANKQSVKYVLSNPPPKDNNEYGQMQTTRPKSNLSNTSADNYSKNTTMVQEPKSASPKPKPFNYQNVDMPMPKMYGPNVDSSSDDDDVVAESANVAVPQLLTKTAVIENTKMYQSSPQAPPKPLPKPEIYNKILPTNYNRSGYPSPPSSVSSRSAQV